MAKKLREMCLGEGGEYIADYLGYDPEDNPGRRIAKIPVPEEVGVGMLMGLESTMQRAKNAMNSDEPLELELEAYTGAGMRRVLNPYGLVSWKVPNFTNKQFVCVGNSDYGRYKVFVYLHDFKWYIYTVSFAG